ncbi:MAG: ATP-dependent zinc metalloprotease FtsH [Spirochaetota bacterium]|jgi:cell division protease FtsH|uniref:ATP-dependent zinc metalloprotease FtsH n=1 Tax=uncultured spirochete TaxID=156406 RepID=A0A3P3XFT6_9SPIR|nr:ATP-dependent zinc metalloprotease FtsH [Rectinema subterraneum]SLM10057.1 protease, ATP-dependent zinc-metallo [uncultured spirochete]HBE46434.1 cell division protein FtsH [Spirochaetaceae bacterium]HCX96460.1 cell division protein FtsH [Spirochaetaceae bacterium]
MSDQNDNSNDKRPELPPAVKGNRAALAVFFSLIVLFGVYLFFGQKENSREIPYSSFLSYLDLGEVKSVRIIDQRDIDGYLIGKNGAEMSFTTKIPYFDSELMARLQNKGVSVTGAVSGTSPFQILFELTPWIFGFILIWIMMRQMQGNNKAFSFGKSKAKLYNDSEKRVTFDDVAGQKEAKYELMEVIDYLKNPKKFVKMGAKIPKGVLLVGMPGTGKTLIAKATAGEANVPFFHMSGSDFVEMFVGVGASRVRDLFEQGRKHAPCIIFIDELDAVGRTRGSGLGGGHDEREQTLNQMLVEMDGFDTKDGVIVLAATNRPDVLDPALLRPGRFDRQVVVAMPDVQERKDILKIHMSKIPVAENVDVERLARATPGTSGADLANMVNEAALFAIRKSKDIVEMEDFEDARDKILMGVARKSLVIADEEKRSTAIHESGHALLHYFLPNSDPLHKVTIVPRGRALGLALSLPEKDTYSRTYGWLYDRIVISYGGYAAEKIVYGETTTGAAQDIKQATEIARKMVREWGMSDAIGPVSLGDEEEPIFLGREIAQHKDYSEETARKIDAAIQSLLSSALEKAMSILTREKDRLLALADRLMQIETLEDSDVRTLLGLQDGKFVEEGAVKC